MTMSVFDAMDRRWPVLREVLKRNACTLVRFRFISGCTLGFGCGLLVRGGLQGIKEHPTPTAVLCLFLTALLLADTWLDRIAEEYEGG